jgi:manganese/iron transport system permease protein
MAEWLLEPLNYAFMQRGLLAAIIVGAVCATVGSYIVLRGMAFFGDALAHAILPGIAAGYLLGDGGRTQLFLWALAAAILSSLGIGALGRIANLREDTAIGIVFSGMFALGIAMISTGSNYALDLSHFLFGNVLGVSESDLWITAALGSIVILLILAFYKEFLLLSFDSVLATTLRIPSRALETLLYILIAVAIVVSLQTVGVALMVAMLVTPAATAYLLSKRLPIMMLLAVAFAVSSGIIGLYISYYLGVSSGAAIVLTCTAFFIIVWLARQLRSSMLAGEAAST